MKPNALLLLGFAAAPLAAQQPAQTSPPTPTPLTVGTEAPDFTLPAATEAGVSANALRLRDLRGKTVVIAFFFKARTGG